MQESEARGIIDTSDAAEVHMSESDKIEDPTKGLSWAEKKRWAAKQMRTQKQEEIAAAEEEGDQQRADELREELTRARDERREAKKRARDLRAAIKEKLPTAGGRTWADNDTARAIRSGRKAEGVGRRPDPRWNLQPGEMVRLVNKCEAWTESYMVKELPKGALGILLDPPTGQRAAVMFGTDVFTVECKKLRAVRED